MKIKILKIIFIFYTKRIVENKMKILIKNKNQSQIIKFSFSTNKKKKDHLK